MLKLLNPKKKIESFKVHPSVFKQDIPEETFQEVADIAKEAVQKVDEAQNVEQR